MLIRCGVLVLNFPALLVAAHNVAAAVHEEQATSSRNPAGVTEDAVAESEPGSYFLGRK